MATTSSRSTSHRRCSRKLRARVARLPMAVAARDHASSTATCATSTVAGQVPARDRRVQRARAPLHARRARRLPAPGRRAPRAGRGVRVRRPDARPRVAACAIPSKRWAKTRFTDPTTGRAMFYSTNHDYDPVEPDRADPALLRARRRQGPHADREALAAEVLPGRARGARRARRIAGHRSATAIFLGAPSTATRRDPGPGVRAGDPRRKTSRRG